MPSRPLVRSSLAALMLLGAVSAAAEELAIDYSVDGRPHRGYLVHEAGGAATRPLLVLYPNWLGTTAANRRQAQAIAGRDYVIFVADMFGAQAQPDGPQAAGKAVGALYADRAELRKRAIAARAAALDAVAARQVAADTTRVAAIGFCFGGATALELARTGFAGPVVSFHGNLALPGDPASAPIRAPILALHGDADPHVPPEQVEAFLTEMRAAGADWQLVRFGGAVHSFTDPHADQPGRAMYDPRAAARAFAMMRDFLAGALPAATP